jgi:transposase-like protein
MEAQSSSKVTSKRRARGKWTQEQREQMIAESRQSGASVSEVAQRHGVRVALLSGWRRKAGAAKSAPIRFASVQVNQPREQGVIEIDLSSRCVRVHGVVDGAMLREVLAATR